jgi:hypothetical protein
MPKKKIEINPDAVYKTLNAAFDYFNKTLFAWSLPVPVLSIRAKSKSAGYFAPARMANPKAKKEVFHEIALNPSTFDRPPVEILSTLVHDMVHLWQEVSGKPSKNGYHNKQWSHKMIEVGLIPSDDGTPGGKMTGSSMTHYIEKGGEFHKMARSFLKLENFNFFVELPGIKKERPKSKVKFTCPNCGANIWGKPETEVSCTPCGVPMAENEE